MNLTFIKINFILFEIISFLLTGLALIGLFYFSLIFPNLPGLHYQNQKTLNIYFKASYNPGVFSDIDLVLSPNKTDDTYIKGVIAYNQAYFPQNSSPEKIISKLNSINHNTIHIFNNNMTAQQYLTNIRNIVNHNNSIYGPAIIFVVICFCFFMKVTLIRTSVKQIQGIKSNKKKMNKVDNILEQISRKSSMLLFPESENSVLNESNDFVLESNPKRNDIINKLQQQTKNFFSKDRPIYNPILSLLNPKNLFNLIFFELTSVIILPLLFPNFTDLHIIYFYGFRSNMFSSIYYYRSRFGQKQFNATDFDMTKVIANEDEFTKHYFFMHRPMQLSTYEGTDMNPYLLNLTFLCSAVWISRFFKPFDKLTKKMEPNIKKSLFKKVMKYAVPIVIFSLWGIFFLIGLLNVMEYIYLFHREIVYSFQKLFDVKIIFFLGSFYFHIYFYGIMIIYTLQIICKNKSTEMVLI